MLGDVRYADVIINRFYDFADDDDERNTLESYRERRFSVPLPSGLTEQEKVFHMAEQMQCYLHHSPTGHLVHDPNTLVSYLMDDVCSHAHVVEILMGHLSGDRVLKKDPPLGPHTAKANGALYRRVSISSLHSMQAQAPVEFGDFTRRIMSTPQLMRFLSGDGQKALEPDRLDVALEAFVRPLPALSSPSGKQDMPTS